MIFSLILGLIAGTALIVYRGLYLGPWNEAVNTMGTCLIAAIVIYIVLQIIGSMGSFFAKLVFVIALTAVILFGGRKLWNRYNPSNQIDMPQQVQSLTQPVTNVTEKIKDLKNF